MRTLFLSLFVSAGLALPSLSSANAAPIQGNVVEAATPDQITLVRNGCGRGRHFSRRYGGCLWNGPRYYRPYYRSYNYAPPIVYGPPTYSYGYYGGPRVYGYYGPRYYGYYGPRYYGYYGPRYYGYGPGHYYRRAWW